MKLSVIGTGYVGLVSGTCFAEMGNHVICVDNNQEKLNKMRNAIVPIYEPGLEVLFKRNIEKKRLEFTDDLEYAVNQTDVIFLCLPTPQGEDGSADLKYVFGVAEDIAKILKDAGDKDFKIIVNKSTVPVGTSETVTNIIRKEGVLNFEVISNPEFLREGFAVDDFMKPDRIVIGAKSKEVFEKMRSLYEPFVRQGNPIIEMDPYSSEITKYASNSYLAMRITFMNELANFTEKVGGNIDKVRIGMSADSRIGKRFLFPGIGYGGSCFPKDVRALIRTGDDKVSGFSILKTVDDANNRQKLVLVDKVLNHFNNDLSGKAFGIWGLSFKPNTDDMREAPSIYIIRRLLELGATISAYDPEAIENAKLYLGDKIEYAKDQYAAIENKDALLILTEWNEFRNPDFNRINEHLKNKVIFDGRNVFTPDHMKEIGFIYYSIGRPAVK